MGEREQAIGFLCAQLHAPNQRRIIAAAMARERIRVLIVRISSHTMVVRMEGEKTYPDDETEEKIRRGDLSNKEIRELGNALRQRLGQEPTPNR